MPTTPTQTSIGKVQARPAFVGAQGDIRRGGWILILVGVVLVLVAVLLVIVY